MDAVDAVNNNYNNDDDDNKGDNEVEDELFNKISSQILIVVVDGNSY